MVSWYNGLAAEVQRRIEALDWTKVLGDRPPEITSRPKTIGTLREKLLRQRTTPSGRIGDIAGVRFEAQMTLSEQDAVVAMIAEEFGGSGRTVVKDLRRRPHSGYRAVHVHLRLERLVEVQVRTHLQGEWANLYEAAADVLGREIRYGTTLVQPEAVRIVRRLQRWSIDLIAAVEEANDRLAWLEDGCPPGKTLREAQDEGEVGEARTVEDLRQIVDRTEISVREAMNTTRQRFRDAKQGG